jgi:hypothetical protein
MIARSLFLTLSLILPALPGFSGAALAAAKISPEMQPPPYVEIMPQYVNSGRTSNKNIEFDAYTFNTGKNQTEEAEGRIWVRHFELKPNLPQTPSALQVARNYANLLRSLGSANMVELQGNDIKRNLYGSHQTRAVSGKFVKDGKEVWVEVQADPSGRDYYLIILELVEFVQQVGEAKSPAALKPEPAPAPTPAAKPAQTKPQSKPKR